MSNFRVPRKRVRVLVRPKERARRARSLAALVVVLVLGSVAYLTLKRLSREASAPLENLVRLDSVRVEAPESMRVLMQNAVDRIPGSPGDKAQALKNQFPFIADVRVRRNWTEKTATLTLDVRHPIAYATRQGKSVGFLSDQGAIFDAPKGTFILSGPSIGVEDAPWR